MNATTGLRLAIDIGGTFTDTVLADANGTILGSTKTATTPKNPTLGAAEGAQTVLKAVKLAFGDLTGFVHGTTLATNALIERNGALVSTITTEGFRDILEIGYERRYSQYDINIDKPDLIVPRSRSFTVVERVSVSGDILIPLDDCSVQAAIDALEDSRTEAVAICLLHAYANPSHERRLRDMIHARLPDMVVSLSSDVSPEAREFDRLCTTVANAYIQPLMSRYLTDFQLYFEAEGLICPILMITASGGMTTLETARKFPIRLVESGPAGGAILAANTARKSNLRSVLSFDMGGTTAKLCLIDDFRPQTARRFEVSRAARFIKGSGMPVRIPVLEMIEIGAGGGSIATVDRLGRLQVGPQSAGSEPGPAAFGKGGTAATVTDADLALGYLDPSGFAEGKLTLDTDASDVALHETIGERLKLNAGEAAVGISEIVDESMASAGRMHAVESGKDLSHRTMIAFGGNGPLHATRVARRAGVTRILIPPDPGVGSAVGFLFAPVSFELVRSHHTTLSEFDFEGVNALFNKMIADAEPLVRRGAPDQRLDRRRTAFMRYRGQGHEIEIPLPDRTFASEDIADLTRAFETSYARQFSRAVPGMTIEVLNWGISIFTTRPRTPAAIHRHPPARPHRTRRQITCDLSGKRVDAEIIDRTELRTGDQVTGPALIVEAQTTTLVSADFTASVDSFGNLLLTKSSAGGAE
ncbi:hydantoinase/oxoprolinase family protein [Roseobacter sp. YSTF-M11]|uniref:Hydantoinase/oxoprolinase family protein n=1 Tax=Roseobacter insulae TaxID=2859783 RepID=A0A9X1JXA3_9RHOB|nr:hydantoinase/oxoprolinase family protein [Roseobacter insulae]MBW4707010.1 hydantoinase/oxoprolinase family protein [Roseobacter insulae]